jgi:hypothetical protein
MRQVELYRELREAAVHRSHFFGRQLIVVPREAFLRYEEHFQVSFNILNCKKNFRTKTHFRHIHAIENGGYVAFHFDYTNPDKGVLHVISHAVVDVLPYFLYVVCTFKRPYTFDRTT